MLNVKMISNTFYFKCKKCQFPVKRKHFSYKRTLVGPKPQ